MDTVCHEAAGPGDAKVVQPFDRALARFLQAVVLVGRVFGDMDVETAGGGCAAGQGGV